MQFAHRHSHLNGEEYLLVERSETWRQIDRVIRRIDADTCRPGDSEEADGGFASYDAAALDTAFEAEFRSLGWTARPDPLPMGEQGRTRPPPGSPGTSGDLAGRSVRADLVKDRVSVDLRFSRAAFDLPSVFAGPLASFVTDESDVGIVFLPTKPLASAIRSRGFHYEECLEAFRRQPRGFPAVPLVLIGVAA